MGRKNNTHFNAKQFFNVDPLSKAVFALEELRDDLDESIAKLRICIEKFRVLRRAIARDISMSEQSKLVRVMDIDQDMRDSRAMIAHYLQMREEIQADIDDCLEPA